MRRRRMGFSLLIVAAVIVIAAGAFIAGKSLLSKNNPQQASNTKTASNSDSSGQKAGTATTTTTPAETGFDVKLADGTALKAIYTTSGTTKKFSHVSPKEKNVWYDINPAGDKLLIFDKDAQSILLIDDTGKVTDVTNPSYVSTKGVTTTKESALASNKSYIWCTSPAFISDTKIAYISQLPYFGKTTQYVWTVDITTAKHKGVNISAVSGEKITFGKLEAKGLKIDIDGSVWYITSSGSAVQ